MPDFRLTYHKPSDVFKDEALVKRLEFLTNGGWGRTHSTMFELLQEKEATHIWIAKEADIVVGWATVYNNKVDIYVQRVKRRKGIGFRLASQVALKLGSKKSKKLRCVPGDKAGLSLYDKTPFKIQ